MDFTTFKDKLPVGTKHTSDYWYHLTYPTTDLIILDPDGWDRSNYHYSYYEELITSEEFMDRVCRSTCIYSNLPPPKEI